MYLWLKNNAVFLTLIIIFLTGLSISAYYSIISQYIPTTKTVVFKNNSDVDAIVIHDNTISIPPEHYFSNDTVSKVSIKPFFKNYPNQSITIKEIVLSSNTSNSLLSITDPKAVRGTDEYFAIITASHPLKVKNTTESYRVDIFYRKNDMATTNPNKTNTGQVYDLSVPISWNVIALDLGRPTYFWIIFLGVMISKVFSYSIESPRGLKLGFTTLDLLWVPFSAVITLLIFSSFTDQVRLTNDIMSNIALAFGFGFGFDKVFEAWPKAAGKTIREPRG